MIRGRSPLFQDQPFVGVRFEGDGGRIHGSASILALEDGRLVFDFDKLHVDGRQSAEYGSVSPADPAPVASPSTPR